MVAASPSIAAIAASRVLIAVAHPRIAAGLEALLDAEHRYEVQRASSGADLEGRDADAVIADAVFIKMNGAPAGIPAIVLLDASADRASLADRVPLARAWLTTSSTGDELIAALDRTLAASTPAATAAPPARPTVPVAATVVTAPVAPAAIPSVPVVPSPIPSLPLTPAVRDGEQAPVEAAALQADAAAVASAEGRLEAIGSIALVVFGVACASVSLAFIWLAVRP